MTEPHPRIEPSLTRRRLVQSGGAAVAGLCVLGGLPAEALASSGPPHLRRSLWATRTGRAFPAVGASGGTGKLHLIEVADLARAKTTPALAGREDAFALTFSGPPGLGSGIASLRHPTLWWVSVFITPVGPATTEQRYEAVVDRASVR